jgi:hypothetical protein
MSPERIEQTAEMYRSLVTDVQLATEAAAALSPLAAVYLHHKLTSGKDEPTANEPPPSNEPPQSSGP